MKINRLTLLAALVAAPLFAQTTQPVANPITKANQALAAQTKDGRAKIALRSYFPGKVSTPTTLDLTNRIYGGEVDGDACNLTYTGTGWAADFTGSQLWTVKSMLFDALGGTAKGVLKMSRPANGSSAGIHHLSDIGITARVSEALVKIDASESNYFENCTFATFTKAPCVLLTTETGGLIDCSFYKCHFSTDVKDGVIVNLKFTPRADKPAITNGVIEMIRFVECSFTATMADSLAGVLVDGVAGAVPLQVTFRDCSFETDRAKHAVWSKLPMALFTFTGNRAFSKDEVIKIDGECGNAEIRRNHLKSWGKKPVLDLAASNFGSLIEGLFYVHDAGDVWVRFRSEPQRTTIIGWESKVEISGKRADRYAADKTCEDLKWIKSYKFQESP